MKGLIISAFVFLLLISIPMSMAYETLVSHYAHQYDSLTKYAESQQKPVTEKTAKAKRSGGGGFITLWVRKDNNSPCEKSDVITMKGKVLSGKYGVAVNYLTKRKVGYSDMCPITDGKPLPIGWWNQKFMNIWMKKYGY